MARSLETEELKDVVAIEKKPALALFSGVWCGDCAAFAPLWHRWTSGRKEAIFTIEVGRDSQEWDDWELDEIPTVIAFVDGTEKGRRAGMISKEDLDSLAALLRPKGKASMSS